VVKPLIHRSIYILSNSGRRFYTNLLVHSATKLKNFKKKLQLMMLHSQLTLNLIPPADLLINAAKGSIPTQLPPGDIHRVMPKNSKHSVHTTCIEYKVSSHKEHHSISPSLIDRGANGGVAANNVRIIFKTNRTVEIKGIDNHNVLLSILVPLAVSLTLIRDPLLVL
jgi:hypothetical protein